MLVLNARLLPRSLTDALVPCGQCNLSHTCRISLAGTANASHDVSLDLAHA